MLDRLVRATAAIAQVNRLPVRKATARYRSRDCSARTGRTSMCTELDLRAQQECGWKRGERAVCQTVGRWPMPRDLVLPRLAGLPLREVREVAIVNLTGRGLLMEVRLGNCVSRFNRLGNIFAIETSGSDAFSRCCAMGKIGCRCNWFLFFIIPPESVSTLTCAQKINNIERRQ